MSQSVQWIFDSALSHTRRSDAVEIRVETLAQIRLSTTFESSLVSVKLIHNPFVSFWLNVKVCHAVRAVTKEIQFKWNFPMRYHVTSQNFSHLLTKTSKETWVQIFLGWVDNKYFLWNLHCIFQNKKKSLNFLSRYELF